MTNLNVNEIKAYLTQFYDIEKINKLEEKNINGLYKLYKDTQLESVEIGSLENNKGPIFVTSPDGYVPAKSLVIKRQHHIFEVLFNSGKKIKTSPHHMFQLETGTFITTSNLGPGVRILSEDGTDTVLSVTDLNYMDDVYDIAVNHENHRYYTDGLSSHNSGSGKSLFLQNMAVNYASNGMNVVYISLELSEHLCSMRIDAMTTGYGTTEILKNINEVSMQVAAFKKKYKGNLQIKQMPSGITTNDIRAYIKEFEIQQGLKVDVILVDYLDLLMPNGKKISPSDLFVKDKYVSEELRNLGIELKTLMVSASQLNRSSYDEVEFDPSNISGGISKINTADNVLGIFTTAAMREAGRYQLQFLKTRSSSGVGSKVDLKFNQRTLRIEDLDEDAEPMKSTTESVLDKIKNRNAPTALDNTNVVEKVTNVRDLLAKLNK